MDETGHKGRLAYNAYMNDYMKKRYAKRRQIFIERLGGVCVKCQSSEDLQLDHIDSKQKLFNIAKFFSYKLDIVLPEVDKCQLLCKPCHLEKTLVDKGHLPAKGTHGTLASYRYCKCSLCKEVWNAWHSMYKKRRREAKRSLEQDD